MKKQLFSIFVIFFAMMAAATTSAHAGKVDDIFNPAEEYGFTDENRVEATELSDMRGGFIMGGLNFDFRVNTSTFVNGILQHMTTITSDSISARNGATNLNETMNGNGSNNGGSNQPPANNNEPPVNGSPDVPPSGTSFEVPAGNGSTEVMTVNSTILPDGTGSITVETLTNNLNVQTMVDNGALTTVIQNSTDGAVIQQFNNVDLSVSNLSALQAVNIAPQMDFQAIQALR